MQGVSGTTTPRTIIIRNRAINIKNQRGPLRAHLLWWRLGSIKDRTTNVQEIQEELSGLRSNGAGHAPCALLGEQLVLKSPADGVTMLNLREATRCAPSAHEPKLLHNNNDTQMSTLTREDHYKQAAFTNHSPRNKSVSYNMVLLQLLPRAGQREDPSEQSPPPRMMSTVDRQLENIAPADSDAAVSFATRRRCYSTFWGCRPFSAPTFE